MPTICSVFNRKAESQGEVSNNGPASHDQLTSAYIVCNLNTDMKKTK